MALIDQAVKLAAEADEPLESNFVRKHSLEQAEKEGSLSEKHQLEFSLMQVVVTVLTLI